MCDEQDVNNNPDFWTDYVKSNLRLIPLYEIVHLFIE